MSPSTSTSNVNVNVNVNERSLPNRNLVSNHPLFTGLGILYVNGNGAASTENETTMAELQALMEALVEQASRNIHQCAETRQSKLQNSVRRRLYTPSPTIVSLNKQPEEWVEAPEAVALFSYGLLLRLDFQSLTPLRTTLLTGGESDSGDLRCCHHFFHKVR